MMHLKNKKNNQGFTLMELMVVVAIIGLFATAGILRFNTIRAKARDVKRIVDLIQMSSAIETYYDDYGVYPNSCASDSWNWSGHGTGDSLYTNCPTPNGYIVGMSAYISRLPVDPTYIQDPVHGYIYRTDIAHQEYKIMAWGSVERTVAQGSDFARCPSSCGAGVCSTGYSLTSYAIYSGGGACW